RGASACCWPWPTHSRSSGLPGGTAEPVCLLGTRGSTAGPAPWPGSPTPSACCVTGSGGPWGGTGGSSSTRETPEPPSPPSPAFDSQITRENKAMSRSPDFIVMGAMKCATSTLHEQLAIQPGFFMSRPKEPNFFSNDEIYSRGLDWYYSLFAGATASDLCGESSTHYTKLPTYPKTVERLWAALPEVKLIYVMRHPVDRLISQYLHECTQKTIRVPIDAALDRHPELIAYSRYSMQLEPFLTAYGPKNILPVFFERLVSHPEEELE